MSLAKAIGTGAARLLGSILAFSLIGAGTALADGRPHDWEMGLQKAATPLMDRVTSFHNLLLIIISLIVLFVLGLLIWVMIRYRESRNPTPSSVTHNTLLEVVWTVVPVLILVVIAVPSFRLLYYSDKAPALTPAQKKAGQKFVWIKVTGHQWYWTYDFDGPQGGRFRFESRIACKTKADCDAAPKTDGRKPIRLLDTDNPVVVPVGTTVRVQVTSADVIHSWAMPSGGTKIDAVPGRLNETWLRFHKKGWYYGQCSELCGAQHAFMPIAVHVVSAADYKKWLETAWQKAKKEDVGWSIVEEPKKTSMLETKPTKTIKR
jgi:cytochrome c oxidase subunit 2